MAIKDLANKETVAEVAYETTESNKTIGSEPDKATQFRLKHGISKTRAKLLKKYNCKTNEEYKALKKSRK